MLVRPTWLVVLSLANICFLESWARLLTDLGLVVEGRVLTKTDYLGTMISVLLLAASLYGLEMLAKRLGGRWPTAVRRLVVAVAPIVFLSRVPDNADRFVFSVWSDWLVGALVVVLLLLPATTRVWRFSAGFLERGLLVLSPFVFITFAQAFAGTVVAPRHVEPPARSNQTLPASGRRVLWILFDELDYGIAFPARPPSLLLPEFDRLASESLFATDALPPGNATFISLPGLLTGRAVQSAEASGLDVTFVERDTGLAVSMKRARTVFTEVQASGYPARLVGGGFPYCYLLGHDLDACITMPSGWALTTPETPPTIVGAVEATFRSLLPLNFRRIHAESLRTLASTTASMASDDVPGLLFVHLLVPHPPPIYDRTTDHFTLLNFSREGYFDNLALADRTLGEIRRAMEAAGTWDRTTVIVSSDHRWRKTKDVDASRGRSDFRVPFIVKPAGSSEGGEFGKIIETRMTAELVLAFLAGSVVTVHDVSAFFDSHQPRSNTDPADEVTYPGFF